jgi:hypothetical protein
MGKQPGGSAIRPLVTFTMLVAAAIAYFPAEIILRFWVGLPDSLLAVLVSAVIFVAFSLVDSEGHAKKTVRSRPPLRTVAIGIVVGVVFAILAAVFLLAIFAVVYFFAKQISQHWDASRIVAITTDIVSAAGTIVFSVASGDKIREGLYRRQATQPSPFEAFALNLRGKELIFGAVQIVIVTVLAVIWVLAPKVTVGYAIGALALLLLTGLIALGEVDFPDDAAHPADDPYQEKIAGALRQLGYDVTFQPRVGDIPTDELLKLVDFLAQREGRVFTVRICLGNKNKPEISWSSVADMIVAANALQRYTGDQTEAHVESAIILADARPDRALSQLAGEGQLRLIEVGSDADATTISEAIRAGLADRSGSTSTVPPAPDLPNGDGAEKPWREQQ